MRRGNRENGWLRREVADLMRLAGLALELDGFIWLRVALTSLRRRLHGRVATAVLVLAVALRFAPFLGAAVCGASFDSAPPAPPPLHFVARAPDLREPVPFVATGSGVASAEEPGTSPPREGRSRRAFGATRWPEAIVPKEVRLPRPDLYRP